MNIVKSCLAIFGLMMLLLVGSCMVGGYGLYSLGRSVMSEQSGETDGFTEAVSTTPDVVRKELYDFFESATYDTQAHPVTVNHMTDGSVQMVMGTANAPLLTINATIKAGYGDYSSVTFAYNATPLAATRKDGLTAEAIQAELYKRLKTAIREIETKGTTSRGLTITSLLESAGEPPKKRFSL